MYCKNDCGRRALSRRWMLCKICWDKEQGVLLDKPKPKPVLKNTTRDGVYAIFGYENGPITHREKAPQEGIPYDWHTGKILSRGEAATEMQRLIKILPLSWTIGDLSRRFNVNREQTRDMLFGDKADYVRPV